MVDEIFAPQRGTRTDVQFQQEKDTRTPQQKCEERGGFWDVQRQTCLIAAPPPKPPPEPEPIKKLTQEEKNSGYGVVTDAKGNEILLTPEVSAQRLLEVERLDARERGIGAAEAGELKEQREALAAEGSALAGEVGQVSPSEGIIPTDLSQVDAITTGVRQGIPRALTLAGGAISAGFIAAPVTGGASAAAGIIGGVVLFTGSIAASILGDMQSQRRDNTTAQQRTLDEGKQTLQDWATMAAADPTNRQFAVTQFNRQLQLIQDAHVQMITDTNADFANFETAVPNLAEFNSFYSVGGERDALVADMQFALRGQLTPDEVTFRMMTMADRRVTNRNTQNTNTAGFLGELIP